MKTIWLTTVLGLLCMTLHAQADAAARKILLEMQTSTTCGPCYAADVFYFQQWLPNYGGADQVVTLAYHVWWPSPGNDPMYLANTPPVQGRMAFYAPSGNFAPRAWIDGFIDGGSGYSSWPGAIEGRFLDPAPVSITLTGTKVGNTLNLNAAITADRAVNSSMWRVHWVMVESGISEPQNTGTGYVPFVHEYVHRGMYPDHNGTPITINQGQTVHMPQTITINSAWVANSCRVIVFVQNTSPTDKKVQNVEVLDISTLTSVGDPVNGVPTAFDVSQNYPNPFNPTTTIDYAIREKAFVEIKIFDLLGREVRTLVQEERGVGIFTVPWDGKDTQGTNVPSGLYLYRMNAGSFSSVKKMMLVK